MFEHLLSNPASHLHAAFASLTVGGILALLLSRCILLFQKRNSPLSNDIILVSVLFLVYLVTYYSGYGAAELASTTFEVPENKVEQHHFWGQFLYYLIPLLGILLFVRHRVSKNQVAKKGQLAWIVFAILGTSCGLALWTAFLGGNLVYQHGAGVSPDVLKTISAH